MNGQLTIIASVLLLCSLAEAQSPPSYEAYAFVGWSSGGGVYEQVPGPTPPYSVEVDASPCNWPSDRQTSVAVCSVDSGTFAMNINSDLCFGPNLGSREQTRAEWEWHDIHFSGPHPDGTPFTVDLNLEYTYSLTTYTGSGGFALSALELVYNGPTFQNLPPTGGTMTPMTVQLNGVINSTGQEYGFTCTLTNSLYDDDDSAQADVQLNLRPADNGPVFTNFSIPNIIGNSAQADIVDNFWQGGETPCPADLSGDTVVDVNDLLAMLAAWGPSAAGDITGDGITDVNDLLAVLAGWGPCG